MWKGCFFSFLTNLQFAINDHWAIRELHHQPLQLHSNDFDGGTAVSLVSSYLDVKVLVTAHACRGQDIVAGGVQLENIPIKGFEVVVAPRTADLAIVDWTHTYKDKSGRDTTRAGRVYTSFYLHEWTLTQKPTNSPVIFDGIWEMVLTAASVERSKSYSSVINHQHYKTHRYMGKIGKHLNY